MEEQPQNKKVAKKAKKVSEGVDRVPLSCYYTSCRPGYPDNRNNYHNEPPHVGRKEVKR